nr:immunoglobulin heavy chain junction region [Mus musculus]
CARYYGRYAMDYW